MPNVSHSPPKRNETIWELNARIQRNPDPFIISALSFFFIMVIIVCIGIYLLERRREKKYRRKVAEEE
ncbi:hypothetical protein Y032_0063g3448 [Ancylostoma ceylanicum]|uniref:Uncharacterized protein n=1 Tax=Ancylostoma ceylanicum TaxID=53326 RepID=A0A016U259_9BILA|nr:hypothetical protein Y032_0063g3448 [Ancylostoma ceylanicum]